MVQIIVASRFGKDVEAVCTYCVNSHCKQPTGTVLAVDGIAHYSETGLVGGLDEMGIGHLPVWVHGTNSKTKSSIAPIRILLLQQQRIAQLTALVRCRL